MLAGLTKTNKLLFLVIVLFCVSIINGQRKRKYWGWYKYRYETSTGKKINWNKVPGARPQSLNYLVKETGISSEELWDDLIFHEYRIKTLKTLPGGKFPDNENFRLLRVQVEYGLSVSSIAIDSRFSDGLWRSKLYYYYSSGYSTTLQMHDKLNSEEVFDSLKLYTHLNKNNEGCDAWANDGGMHYFITLIENGKIYEYVFRKHDCCEHGDHCSAVRKLAAYLNKIISLDEQMENTRMTWRFHPNYRETNPYAEAE